MTQSRSAEAGILGFTYQFIQSTIKILSLEDSQTTFTIEGIEDLDVASAEENLLIQYKYHDAKKFTLSTIDKPIALMFKHFIDPNSQNPSNYVLFSYFGQKHTDSNKNIVTIDTQQDLQTLLNYANAKKILAGLNWSSSDELAFLKILKFEEAVDFDESINQLTRLLKSTFNISEYESQNLFLANSIYYINQLAIKKTQQERTITKQQFIDYLNSQSQTLQHSIIQRLYGKKAYISFLKKYMQAKNIKKFTSSYIIYLKDINDHTSRFIIDLANKFVANNAKKDTLPLTIIINDHSEKIINLKRNLLSINSTENHDLLFNDGYEMYHFCSTVFSNSPLLHLQPNGQKTQMASYNYRLLSFETYQSHKSDIQIDRPTHIIINNAINVVDLQNTIQSNVLKISNIEDIELLNLLGA
ncbi:hypothetical protein PDN15_26885 [Bacillus cereus]|uniref:hypothetical protein n=1 Tax=Bacillus cereus group TaxID=86661 RepID=UPI002FF2C315|nr:hypothetical protein [Bacillus cereus]MDA2347844.1 hypothetical protein [Bacillus cereus]MDA2353118.1 hypothetical protein [Bacillus cereus]